MFLVGREFLSSVHGLGLKSVECIRLLALHHNAFPVSLQLIFFSRLVSCYSKVLELLITSLKCEWTIFPIRLILFSAFRLLRLLLVWIIVSFTEQVDTNVGRICVRLGWVPLEPLPEELQLHVLELWVIKLNCKFASKFKQWNCCLWGIELLSMIW